MVGKMSLDLLNLETLKFLMHFRELGSSLIFYHTYSYIFFLFSYIFFFILIFSHFLIHIFSSSFFSLFYLLPLNSKIVLYLPPPPCLDVSGTALGVPFNNWEIPT
jgi:hypothetical protein